MQARIRTVTLTVAAALVGIAALIACTQLINASSATASSANEAYLDQIAKAYHASAIKYVDNTWNNRTDVEMIIGSTGYTCLMPTPEQVKTAEPLDCTSFPFVATFA